MNQETIWSPRPATLSYAISLLRSGEVWRRNGKNWMVSFVRESGYSSFIELKEVVYLNQVKGNANG